MLNSVAHSRNFTFTIENSPDNLWTGLKKDGNWRGVVGHASKNSVDFSIGALPIDFGTAKVTL